MVFRVIPDLAHTEWSPCLELCHKFHSPKRSYIFLVLGQSGNLCRGHLLVPQTVCRWEVMSFLLDESIVCGIDFSNTLQGHTCFWDIFFVRLPFFVSGGFRMVTCNKNWLVVWNMAFIFPYSWECHHPNWPNHIFQMGRSTTKQLL